MPRRNTSAAYRRRRADRQYAAPPTAPRPVVNRAQVAALRPAATVYRHSADGTPVYRFESTC